MRFSRFIPVAFAALATLPAIASAQVSLTNIGPKFATAIIGTSPNTAHVGPYQTKVTGLPNSSAFDVFCIDADHGFQSGTAYNAYILTFSEAVSSVLNHGGRTNLQALTAALGTSSRYGGSNTTSADFLKDLKTESVLAGSFGATPNNQWDEIHYAMWGLFSNSFGILPSAGAAASATLESAAETVSSAPGYNYADWRIIIDANAWDSNFHGDLRQAVLTNVVPEPGTYALMGFGLIGLFGAARRRKRAVKH